MKRFLTFALVLLSLSLPVFAQTGYIGVDYGFGFSDTDISIAGGYEQEIDKEYNYSSLMIRGATFVGETDHVGILYRAGYDFVDDADYIGELSCDFAMRDCFFQRLEFIKALGVSVSYSKKEHIKFYNVDLTGTLELMYMFNRSFGLYAGADIDIPLVVEADDDRISLSGYDQSITGYAVRGFAGAVYRY